MKWIGAVLLLVGCDRLLGLSPPTYVPPDAPVQVVTGEYRYLFAVVDSAEQPAVLEMPAAADTEIDALLDDGTVLPVTRADDGTFRFSTPLGSPYRLVVRDGDQSTAIEYQGDVPQLFLRRRFFSRTNVPPATKLTYIYFVETLSSQAGTSAIASYGVRTYIASLDTANPQVDWSTTGLGMLSAAAGDRLQYQHWQIVNSAPYSVITEYDERSVEMQDGNPLSLYGTPTALPQDRCVHLRTHRFREAQRLQAATPDQFLSGASWTIDSNPIAALGGGAPLPLVQQNPVSPPADDELDVLYGSPYRGEVDVSNIQVFAQRYLKRPTTIAPLVLANSEQLLDLVAPAPGPSCASNIVDVGATPPALLASASLAGAPLTGDTQGVMIDRSGLVPFEYTLGGGRADLVDLTLYEVISVLYSTTPITAIVPLRSYVATGPTPIQVDPDLLVRGHYYIFDASTRLGLPGAPQLDFRTIAFPIATTHVFTTMFRVAN